MVERLERVGDKLPIHLQIQMKECIAAFRHETATGIKTEWTIIKGHHGSADRAAQAGVQKYPKTKATVVNIPKIEIDRTRFRYVCGLDKIVPKEQKEWELKTTVIKGRGGHTGDESSYTRYEEKKV
jgi:hypothetical protein